MDESKLELLRGKTNSDLVRLWGDRHRYPTDTIAALQIVMEERGIQSGANLTDGGSTDQLTQAGSVNLLRDRPETPDLGHAAEAQVESPPVGGWLALLTATLIVFRPLLGAVSINSQFIQVEQAAPEITALSEWATFKLTTWLSFLPFAIISFRAGLGLAKGGDWSVVRRAQVALWLTGPLAVVVLNGIVPAVTLGSLPGFDMAGIVFEAVTSLISATVVSAIWSAYLSRSRRVRNSYRMVVKVAATESTPA